MDNSLVLGVFQAVPHLLLYQTDHSFAIKILADYDGRCKNLYKYVTFLRAAKLL